jgi:hypothetical protein
MDRTGRTRALWVAALLWMGVIFALSSLPGGSMPAGDYGSLGHFTVYAVLGALYFLAVRDQRGSWMAVVIAVAMASVYGVTDEFHQSFVPGRMPDPADWMMDTFGAFVGAAVTLGVLTWRERLGATDENGSTDQ